MHLALIPTVAARPSTFIARDVARIVRPWALLACGAIAYVTYTAFDSLPGLLEYAPREARTSAPPAPDFEPSAMAPLRVVTKCVEGDVTSYSDGACTPGARTEVIILAPDPQPAPDR